VGGFIGTVLLREGVLANIVDEIARLLQNGNVWLIPSSINTALDLDVFSERVQSCNYSPMYADQTP
jgi:hypothetical protein